MAPTSNISHSDEICLGPLTRPPQNICLYHSQPPNNTLRQTKPQRHKLQLQPPPPRLQPQVQTPSNLIKRLPVGIATKTERKRAKCLIISLGCILASLGLLACQHRCNSRLPFMHLSMYASAEPLLAPVVAAAATADGSRAQNEAQQQTRQAYFAEPLDGETNVQRVPMGRSVRFRCAVNDIGSHKVSWFHQEKRILLAMDNRTVGLRERVQVSSHANSVFFLQIENVQLSDKVSLAPIGSRKESNQRARSWPSAG